MSGSPHNDAEALRVRQAIDWLVRLQHSDDPALRQQCEHWRRQDARHERAWQRISGLHREISRDLGALPGGTVATLENSARRLQRRQALKLLSLATVAGAAAWLGRDLGLAQPLLADQATAVGERRQLPLGDGSTLDLNTDSAVDLQLDGAQRLIVLRRGELFLDCRPGGATPLRVRTPDGLFEAAPDSRFGLRLGDAGTCLSVDQGSVAFGEPPLSASAGQRYLIAGGKADLLPAQALEPNAWRDGLIVTRDMRLDHFLEEVGRYRPGHLGYAPDVAGLRLSGVFRLADTDELLRVLARTLPVRTRYMTRWWVRVEAA
ncbi:MULTISPECIES: FecR family protein [unclassified Pseudomonas]|uniref:FecR family protein n=1 Tax=unclassified Pseudomonas TaxID=196821 RepID=UPI002449886F|nr:MULTISPECIES: FecR family protein [unclassified Pseudomonas]MDH0895434.1 FecR family protein [Pseudomonas sp. GD03875]MDH1065798.1 FecR family protein [Pseudomonas sp. GD03985]